MTKWLKLRQWTRSQNSFNIWCPILHFCCTSQGCYNAILTSAGKNAITVGGVGVAFAIYLVSAVCLTKELFFRMYPFIVWPNSAFFPMLTKLLYLFQFLGIILVFCLLYSLEHAKFAHHLEQKDLAKGPMPYKPQPISQAYRAWSVDLTNLMFRPYLLPFFFRPSPLLLPAIAVVLFVQFIHTCCWPGGYGWDSQKRTICYSAAFREIYGSCTTGLGNSFP